MKQLTALSLVCALSLSPAAFAQNDAPRTDENPTTQNRTNQDRNNRDRNTQNQDRNVSGRNDHSAQETTAMLASWLGTCNESVVELSQFASQRASHQDVKQLAQTLHEEHQKLQAKLDRFSSGTKSHADHRTDRSADQRTDRNAEPRSDRNTAEPATGINRDEDQATNANRQTRRANRVSPEMQRQGMGDYNVLSQVGIEAADESLRMVKEMLAQKQGQNFDMGFIGFTIVSHINMISTMKAMQPHAEGEFAALLDQGIAKTQQHLEKAKQIAKAIEDQEGNRSQNR